MVLSCGFACSRQCDTALKQFAIGYYTAIKDMLKLSYKESNYLARTLAWPSSILLTGKILVLHIEYSSVLVHLLKKKKKEHGILS